jgi:hypothetical protein
MQLSTSNMIRKILFTSLTAIVLSVPTKTMAWGAKGHQLVAEIAFKYLDENTQNIVKHYLKRTTIPEAGTWMDEVRSNNYYNYMKPWHYIDIPRDSVYKPTSEGNIVTVLNSVIAAMKHKENLKDSKIKEYTLIVFHLVGDLHQPLHTGYTEDKGGNTIDIQAPNYTGNLHSFWDTEIIEQRKITIDSCTKYYSTYSPAQIKGITNINLLKWMKESRTLLDPVYNFKDNKVTKEYVDSNVEVIEKQLLIAGLRLASVLTEIFKA